MARFILIFILPYYYYYFFAYATTTTDAASSPIFHLNSSLPSIWHNNDSINMNVNRDDPSRVRAVLSRKSSLGFVCGFYCIDSCISYLFSVIVVGGGGNSSVVWSANGDHPVQENATLQLTPGGDLVLQDSDGSFVWSTNTAGKSVAGMNMTAMGNLVLFNDKEVVVWQSFDYPTDTLLSGQRFYEGQQLFSSSSPTNWSRGLYYANLTMASGLTAFTQVDKGKPQMYYQMKPKQSSIDQTATGHCRLLINNEVNTSRNSDGSNYAEIHTGGFLVNLGTTSQETQSPLDSFIEYVRLTSDGHLKLYRHDNISQQREIVDLVSRDLGDCQHPRLCGEYGLCKEGNCSCPVGDKGIQYFQPSQFQSDSNGSGGGCSLITPLSCKSSGDQRMIEVRNGTYFNVIDPDAAFPNITNIGDCRHACQQNCLCSAAFFKYEKNTSDGYCYMPSEVLSIRQGEIPNYSFKYATYIKVQIPSKERNPVPEGRSEAAPTLAIILGSGSAVVLVILFLSIVIFRKKFSNKTITEDGEDYYIRQVPGMPVRFSNEELRVATRNFKEKLGGGGFGSVFKGVLQDGTEVAVKRLDKMGHAMREFLAEVETIGSIHHFNLVRLIGFSAEKSSSLLVYEYMINGSLDNWIFYRDQKPCLDWETRKKIILGIAKGLAYLHEECRQRIIHLDIKPQNILLDENFNAKISDFGLSKLIDRDESQVLITLRGTPGYIAPECGQSRITVKVDIYSFGIVLLEIVTGRRNLDSSRSESSKHLLHLLQKKAEEEDQLLDIVENLDGEEVQDHREEMVRLIRIAAWCLQNDHTRRPLMSTVVKVLEGVMEVDPNINYKFTHALAATSFVAADLVSAAPQASVLSNPR